MKTNKSGAALIVFLSVFAGLSGCGEEQKETDKQVKQSAAESAPATTDRGVVDKGMEMSGTSVETTEKAEEPVLETVTEDVESTTAPTVEKVAEAVKSTAAPVLEKTVEASQELMSSAETATTKVVATVKEAASDALDIVEPTSAQVRNIQTALSDAGFNPGPVDGVIGPKTMAALERFQQQKGLAIGKITKETLRALGVTE